MAKNTLWIRFACAMLMAMVSQYAAAAITYSVDSVADDVDDDVTDGICHTAAGACTLRAAVMQANVNSSAGGSIIMLPAGTYPLIRPNVNGDPDSNGDLDLDTSPTGSSISIVGAGAATTIIDAQQIDRVFYVHALSSVSISDLTITNGARDDDYGGGIRNDGQLTLTNVIVQDSRAYAGGGIANFGELHLLKVVLQGNIAVSYGGGLYDASIVTLIDCSVDANSASDGGAGGGIFSVSNVTISSNSITRNLAAFGAGIDAGGVLTVVNSTIAGNAATQYGGGLLYDPGAGTHANLYNTTIAYNEADSDQDGVGSGGGVYVPQNNSFNLYNTIIAGNYHIDPAFADDCDGTVQTHAFNRFGNTSQCTITQVSGSYTTLNSLDDLGPLQNNGGPTETVALLTGSNAVDGAAATCLDAFSQPITTDQRGFPRNVANCDIGAYEYGAVDPNDVIFSDGFEEGL